MKDNDKREFIAVINTTADLYDKKIKVERIGVYWQALKHRELSDIKEAINRHIQDPERGRFFPLPADVSAQLPTPDSYWLDADEAWAICPKNEESSSPMCNEVAEALGVARELINAGDLVAARMAFKASYNRITGEAKREGRKPRWWASLGHEPTSRHAAEVKTVELNNLCLPIDERMALPEPEQKGEISLKYLGEKVERHASDPETAKKNIETLKKMLNVDTGDGDEAKK